MVGSENEYARKNHDGTLTTLCNECYERTVLGSKKKARKCEKGDEDADENVEGGPMRDAGEGAEDEWPSAAMVVGGPQIVPNGILVRCVDV